MGKLNPRQRRFAEEYLIDLNASAAARRAGYSKRTAGSQGFDLLKKPEIQELIQQGSDDRFLRCEIDADYVLQKTDELLRRCMQEVEPVTANGGPVLDREGRAVYKFDSAGAARALEIIGKHTSVNAFKPVESEVKPADQNWRVTFVHCSKEEYERREKCIEHKP